MMNTIELPALLENIVLQSDVHYVSFIRLFGSEYWWGVGRRGISDQQCVEAAPFVTTAEPTSV